MTGLSAVLAIAHRDFVKLLRDRLRIAADFVLPLGLVAFLGPALQAGFGAPGGLNLQTFIFTGVLAQTVWQSAALGLVSLVSDRETDFSQEIFVSPTSRYSIVFGKILGESLVALPQAFAIVAVGLLLGVPMSPRALGLLLPVVLAMAVFGGSFGLLVLSNIGTQRAASQVFAFIMLPQFFLAGVFSPIHGLPWWLGILSAITPMRYAVDLVRNVYYAAQPGGAPPAMDPAGLDLAVIGVLFAAFLAVGTTLFVRAERNR